MWGFVFPGQGAQHPGMGQFLCENFKEARLRFEEASDILKINFKQLCFSGSEQDLQLTQNTQPCLLLVSVATYDVLASLAELNPLASAGHSIGEYAALVVNKSLDFRQALKAVRIRGEEMQKAVPLGVGGMCAIIGMTDEQVRETCKWVETESGFKPLEPANFNSPGQVVISGNQQAIAWLQANFKKEALSQPPARAKFIPLKVSAPFHCSLMKPAEEKMRAVLSAMEFQDIAQGVIQNFSAQATYKASELRENLIRQISAPVLWSQCVVKMRELGVKKIIELGSGNVLSGLIKKIDNESFKTFNVTSINELKLLESEIKK